MVDALLIIATGGWVLAGFGWIGYLGALSQLDDLRTKINAR